MPDEDLLLDVPDPEFGSGVVGVCDICQKRQAVIILSKERFKLCVLDFQNKAWIRTPAKPAAPTPPFTTSRHYVPTRATRSGVVPAVVLSPVKAVKRPSVLVVPEVYGLTTQYIEAGVRLAHEGCEVILPDFAKAEGINLLEWGRMRSSRLLMGGVHISQSHRDRALRMLEDCRRFVQTRPMVIPERQAVLGISYGGAWALAFAAQTPGLSALALAYPQMIHPPSFLRSLSVPTLAIYGGEDSEAGAAASLLEDCTARYHLPVDFSVVPEVGHHFLNRDSPNYSLPEAELAWTRLIAFVKGYLFPPPKPPPKPPVVAAKPVATSGAGARPGGVAPPAQRVSPAAKGPGSPTSGQPATTPPAGGA